MANNKALLRYWYRVAATGKPVPGSLIARKSKPPKGIWKEVRRDLCCTTTTTTTSSTTTTTTT